MGLPAWIASNPSASIANTDVVVWHTFGLTHFPSPEDFPVMPAEPMTVLLRPRNFFLKNPALDIPPSYSSSPSGKGTVNSKDKISQLVVAEKGGKGCSC